MKKSVFLSLEFGKANLDRQKYATLFNEKRLSGRFSSLRFIKANISYVLSTCFEQKKKYQKLESHALLE